jgi:spore germination protein PC
MLWHFQELFRRVGWLAEQQLRTEARMKATEEQLQTISKQLAAVEQLLTSLQNQPTTRIDKIEYRFEQLKVDTLSGSLQIGLAHGAEGLIEDLQAGNVSAQNVELDPGDNEDPYIKTQSALQDYLGAELHRDIDEAAGNAGVEAEMELHARIAEDLARQAQERLVVYRKEIPSKEGADDEAVRTIMGRIRADIQSGLKSFFETYGKE